VLRNEEGTAIIGDPRNDSHVFVSQMHLAFARAHNAFVDRARAIGVAEARVSEHAARELRWHYQSVVLREFLPRLIGSPLKSVRRRARRVVADLAAYRSPERRSPTWRVMSADGTSTHLRQDPAPNRPAH
jgi:hypothetical protein